MAINGIATLPYSYKSLLDKTHQPPSSTRTATDLVQNHDPVQAAQAAQITAAEAGSISPNGGQLSTVA